MKDRTIQVFDSYEAGGAIFLGFYAKGHWSQDEFMTGLKVSFGFDNRVDKCKRFRQTIARCIPHKEFGTLLYLSAKSGNGSFPITVLEP